ncbi:hypothetical protein J8J40_28470, partial [Mycobacterium tuberculosis]|nr:hypothetical protein [Mycobacterium tuberculosis]MBP0650992.1 hypothetical protein [Mycobacterium tuberculosis]
YLGLGASRHLQMILPTTQCATSYKLLILKDGMRASDYESEGQEFESLRARHFSVQDSKLG